MRGRETDELGAHVSAAGGVDRAPARAHTLGSAVLQLFTKTPGQWLERIPSKEVIERFRHERTRLGIRFAASHDSYLINLASPDRRLRARSVRSFVAELQRASLLGLDAVVTHPGHATDGDRRSGTTRNADALVEALERTGYEGRVLIESTAGSGRVLGSTFEELSRLIGRVPVRVRGRLGVCIDTCHVWAAGYDLRSDYDVVMERLCDVVGRERVGLFHLNDSVKGLGSRVDRHASIGRGALGLEPFRRLLNDERFAATPKVIETPKGKDGVSGDRRNLRRLRSLRRGSMRSPTRAPD